MNWKLSPWSEDLPLASHGGLILQAHGILGARDMEAANLCGQLRPIAMTHEQSSQPKTPEHATQFDRAAADAEIILPCNRLTDGFEIGVLLAQLRWYLHAAVLCHSYTDEANAKKSIATIKPLLVSLFPEHRGGKAYEIAEAFNSTWDTLHTELFAEEFYAAIKDDSNVLQIRDAVHRLQPFVPTVDQAILEALMAACHENNSDLLRALRLGQCVGEGLFPKLRDDAYFEVIDNPAFAQWVSSGGTGFSSGPRGLGKWRPPPKIIRENRFNVGEVEPDAAWTGELRSLLAAIGLIGPLPVSLDHWGQTPDLRSETIHKLSARIRAHFQVASSQGTDGEVSQRPLQTGESESAHVRSSETTPCLQPTGGEHHVDVRAISSTGETVENADDCGSSVNEEESLIPSVSPTPATAAAAAMLPPAPEVVSSSGSTRAAHAEVHPWAEWTVDDRIVRFRGISVTLSQANADLLKSIVNVKRWPTVDETCRTIYLDSRESIDKLRRSLSAALAKLNDDIFEQFSGLPPSYRAVQRSPKHGPAKDKILKVVMPDGYIPSAKKSALLRV